MNGQQKFAALQESRPPVVGKEVSSFYELPSPQESCTNLSKNRMESSELDCSFNSDDKDTSDKLTLTSFEAPEEVMDQLPPNPSPPPPFKWAQSLQCLLDDMQGVELFQRFLMQEGQDKKSLDFLFACRGVKKVDPTDNEYLYRLVSAVYEKKVKRMNAISDETKREIKRKISRTEIDVNIFDDAQRQVEIDIINTTYPNFLQSDLYIQHLRTLNEHLLETVSPEEPECLPTLHEDSELHLSEKHAMLRKNMRAARIRQAVTMKAEFGSYLKSPYSSNYGSFHARYGSFLPTSAQDSELQSLSSEAMTDDTMSQANSSLDYPMSKTKEKRPMKNRHLYVNRDSLNQSSIIPRTQRHDVDLCKDMSVQEFYEILVKKLNKVAEDQKAKERVNEKLKAIESGDCSRWETIGFTNQKTNKPNEAVFDSTFFFAQSEENDQAILDRHVSRVFDDSGQTPVLSPGCISPPISRPVSEVHPAAMAASTMMQDMTYTNSQRVDLISPFSIVPNVKQKREHDTRSNDSGAVTEWRSDDNLACCPQNNSSHPLQFHSPVRASRESLKRSGRRGCSVNDSASSCVDSGISEVCEPVFPSYSKVTHWLESKTEKEWKNSTTSPDTSLSQKGTYGNHFRGSDVMVQSFGASVSRTAMIPSQSVTQDLSTPASSVPDTITNLIEARRRLEDERLKSVMKSRHASGVVRNRQSFRATESVEEGMSHRKQSKKTSLVAPENSVTVSNNDVTVIGYSYGQGAVPYLTRFHGKNITLKNFKSLLSKKGNFKYYFKKVENAFGTGTVLEEVSDDHAVLPLWEGKVFCVIETVDDISMPLED